MYSAHSEPTHRSFISAAFCISISAAFCISACMLAACGQENRYVAPPPPQVSVAMPVQQEVTRYLETTGNTAAVNTVNLVARVQGFLEKIEYRDGDEVKAGSTLFVIEPEPYQLKLEQAQAAEAGAQATLIQTQAEYDRQVELAGRQVASKAALDNALANRDSARAKLKQAQVDTAQARINLGYTQVKAPFDGIVTARLVSIGELVGVNGPTQLATIVSANPREFQRERAGRAAHKRRDARARAHAAGPQAGTRGGCPAE
jgi:RND family efflux transporter MFP subunit